jgi:hypothetical protein
MTDSVEETKHFAHSAPAKAPHAGDLRLHAARKTGVRLKASRMTI